MRDGALIEGQVLIGEDQALVPYLQSRRGGWMNVQHATHAKNGEPTAHMILQTEHIVYGSAVDGDVQVAANQVADTPERAVEFVLVGGATLKGSLYAAAGHRLSDIVVAAGRFVGVLKATMEPGGRALGDIALHTGAIAFVRDVSGAAASSHEGAAAPFDS
jgi:hypothetical protein